ncbi:MAG: hypothetical protein GF308_11475 [Candidatus Heimdallarchaeota archaeon]|nr:hypothetical protein [Candidatus Heimdallarchaeota archaeon]
MSYTPETSEDLEQYLDQFVKENKPIISDGKYYLSSIATLKDLKLGALDAGELRKKLRIKKISGTILSIMSTLLFFSAVILLIVDLATDVSNLWLSTIILLVVCIPLGRLLEYLRRLIYRPYKQ